MSLFNLVNNATTFDPHASNVRNLIKRLIGPTPIWTQWALVKSVDKGNWTAVVEIQAEEQEYEDTVWLTPIEAGSQTAFVPIPKEGSMVIIMRLDATDWWTIVQCQEVESLYMMGDKYSTIKAEEFINVIVERLNRLEEKLATHQHISGASGSPTTFDVATNSPLTLTTNIDFDSTKNDDIRHGS